MNIGSTLGSSFTLTSSSAQQQSVQQGVEQARQAAHQVVSAATQRPVEGTRAVADGLIKQTQGEQQVEASSKAFSAADQALGTLLDIRA